MGQTHVLGGSNRLIVPSGLTTPEWASIDSKRCVLCGKAVPKGKAVRAGEGPDTKYAHLWCHLKYVQEVGVLKRHFASQSFYLHQ